MTLLPKAHGGGEEPSLVLVGRVLGPLGLRGEVKVEALSDIPDRYAPGATLYIESHAYQVQVQRRGPIGLIVKFHGVDTRDAAEALRGKSLYASQSDSPSLPQDTYYHYDILGIRVFSVQGQELGEVTEILSTGSNDVYVVSQEGRETLLPALAGVVVEVDVKNRRMTVDPPQWV